MGYRGPLQEGIVYALGGPLSEIFFVSKDLMRKRRIRHQQLIAAGPRNLHEHIAYRRVSQCRRNSSFG